MKAWHWIRLGAVALFVWLAMGCGTQAHAANYTFDDAGTPPLNCTRSTAGNYTCPATTLQYGDSIAIAGTRPATLTFAGDLNLNSVSINASGTASDLLLVVNGRLRFTNYAPVLNAHVTAQSVCDNSANCGAVRYGGNLTATVGPIVLGYGANVAGVVQSAGDVTVDTLTIGAPGYTGDAVRASGRLTFNNSGSVFHGHVNAGSWACSGSTCNQRVNGNVVAQSGGIELAYGAVVTGSLSARGSGASVALDNVTIGLSGNTGTAIDTSGPLTFVNAGAVVNGNIYAASMVGKQGEKIQGQVTLGTASGVQLGYGATVSGCIKAPQSTSPFSIRLGQANNIGGVCCVQSDNSCQDTCVSSASTLPPLCAGPPPTSSDIVVNARGTPVDGVYPNMEVWVNGTKLGQVEVTSETNANHTFSAVLPGSGNLSIDVVFTNDAYKPPQDRNLTVNSVTVKGRTLLPTDPGVVLQQPYFRYGTVTTLLAGQVALPTNGALRFNTLPLIVGNCYSGVTGYASIASAMLAAQPDDTITICPGTYSEALTVAKSLTLRARTSTRDVTVDGGSAPAITFANNSALKNFTSSHIAFTSTGNAAYANYVNGVNTSYSFLGSSFSSAGIALHFGNANPSQVFLNGSLVNSSGDMGLQVGSNNTGPVRVSGGTVTSRGTGIQVGGNYNTANLQHQFTGGLVVDTTSGNNATGIDVRAGHVYVSQLAVRSSGMGLNHDAGNANSNQILDSSFYTAGHGIQSSVNLQGAHEYRNVYIRATGSGARGLSVSGGSVFSQLDIQSNGDAIYIDRTHGRSQTHGRLNLRSSNGAGIFINTSGAAIAGSLVFGSTGNPVSINASTHGIYVNDSMGTTASQNFNNLSIVSGGYGILTGDNMAGRVLIGTTDPVSITSTSRNDTQWAAQVRRASAVTVNRLSVTSSAGGLLLDSNVTGAVTLQGRVTEPLRLTTSGSNDHALRLDNTGGSALIDQVVIDAPAGYGLRASSNATVSQVSNFNIRSQREALHIQAPSVNLNLRDGYARSISGGSEAVRLEDQGGCGNGNVVISRVMVSTSGADAALMVKCARSVTVDRLCATGGDRAAYFDSNAGKVSVAASVFSGHSKEGLYLNSATSGGSVTDSCFLTPTQPMAYFPDYRSQTFDSNHWQGLRSGEYRPGGNNGVRDLNPRSSCPLDTAAMCSPPADATLIARYPLDDATAYTGAASEVKDTAGFSGGPFHGKVTGAPLPGASNALPARSGNPGTCGYLDLPGPQSKGGRGELSRLPVNASTGTQTSVGFWMFWDGADSVMPIGWGAYDLWLTNGSFGFNTGNSDVYGIDAAGLANRWVHVVAVFTNGDLQPNRLYIDGNLQSLTQRQGTPALKSAAVQSTLYLGGWGSDEGYRFQGRLDEVQVFNGAVNQTQVNALFNDTHACTGTGPVAEWRMDELSWNGTPGEVKDSSPTGAHGTARFYANYTDQKVPVPASGGKVCGRGDFRDAFNHVDVSHPAIDNLEGPFTVMGWVMMNDYSSYQYIFSNARDCCGAYRGIELMARYGSSRPYFQVWFADGRLVSVQSSVSIATQTWVHIAGTWDGNELRIYVNGALAGSNKAAAGKTLSGPSSFPSTLGAMGLSQGYYNLNGYLDEVKIWNRALSATDIANGQAQENAGKNWDGTPRSCPTPATLKAQYRFEEAKGYDGTATELKDTAGAAGGPFHGKAAGTAMPVFASANPALAGTPGTCGYTRLSGSTSQGPRFEIDNLPVGTAQGDQTSVSFWMNWDGSDSTMPIGWGSYDLWLVSGHFGFNTGNSDVYGISSSGLANRWVHVAAVFHNGNPSRNLLYINGVVQTLTQRTGTPNVRAAVVQPGLAVGGWRSGAGYRFQGLLDELKVFNGTLYPEQVQALYTETHPCSGGAPSSLNAYDSSTPAGSASGVIQTKVAGTPFAVDVVALNTAKSGVDTAFSQDVKVELLANAGLGIATDGNNCPAIATVLQTTTVRLNSGRATVSLGAVPDAWRDARIRIGFPATGTPSVTACSNDNFAIRPAQFEVLATHGNRQTAGTAESLAQASAINSVAALPVHQAGRPWRLVLTAQNRLGQTTAQYAGAPTASQVVCTLPTTGCVSGSLQPGGFAAQAGVLVSNTATYSEVGAVSVQFADTEFAAVDATDGSTDEMRHVVSALTHLGRFVPDHFDVVAHQVVAACVPPSGSGFMYFGQDGPTTQQTVTALNAANQITRNYTGSLARLNLASYAAMGWTADPLPAGAALAQGTDAPTGSWNAGIASWTQVQHHLSKANAPVAPANFSLYAAPVDADAVTVLGRVLVAPGLLARHGRLKLVNVQGGANLDMVLQAEAQYWDGTRFVLNPLDSCTRLPKSAIGFRGYAAELSATELDSGHVVGTGWTFAEGRVSIRVTRPSGGDGKYRGSVDVFLNLGSDTGWSLGSTSTAPGLTHLQDGWDWGSATTANPVGRITLGAERKKWVFRREMY